MKEEREIRRTEREIKDRAKIDEIINAAEYCTIALSTADGKPYAVPMNHVYDGENLYFHCAFEGCKLKLLRSNPNAAFNIISKAEYYQELENAKFTMHYRSVSGFGTAEEIHDTEEKTKVMKMIKKKFIKGDFFITEQIVQRVNIFKIKITEIYGKFNDNI